MSVSASLDVFRATAIGLLDPRAGGGRGERSAAVEAAGAPNQNDGIVAAVGTVWPDVFKVVGLAPPVGGHADTETGFGL
jgi:hypothetical protein